MSFQALPPSGLGTGPTYTSLHQTQKIPSVFFSNESLLLQNSIVREEVPWLATTTALSKQGSPSFFLSWACP